VRIAVLGPLTITAAERQIHGGLRKSRELLAYLAVHPEGVTGEGISADLWPEVAPKYAASQRKLALRKAREMLRTATGLPAPLFITLAGDRYRLDPALIDVDLWQFDNALDRARQAGSDQDQLAALQQAAALYRGPLADGSGFEWAERYAEPVRRRAVDALARTAALRPHDPEQALTALETALARPLQRGPVPGDHAPPGQSWQAGRGAPNPGPAGEPPGRTRRAPSACCPAVSQHSGQRPAPRSWRLRRLLAAAGIGAAGAAHHGARVPDGQDGQSLPYQLRVGVLEMRVRYPRHE
jgi:hypothetical protein